MSSTVLDSLNSGLRRALQEDPRVLLLGEDLLDPYGGAFKVTRGLSTAFPERVLATPISEAGMVGLASGMALRGLRPVVEIMFGDFTTLIADQLINHAAKFAWMFNGSASVPLVVRAPMGGRRGYGPTHSQTLEKLFLGAPGLRVLAPAAFGPDAPGELLSQAILHGDGPTLFVENKLQYLVELMDGTRESGEWTVDREQGAGNPSPLHPSPKGRGEGVREISTPCYTLSLKGAPPAGLTLAAYGYMAELAREAAVRLAYEHEIFCEVVVPTQLAPMELAPVLDSTRRTRRLLAVEEGTRALGWGAEVLAAAAEALSADGELPLRAARRVAARDLPIPASGALEGAVLPGVDAIVEMAQKMV